MMGLHPESPDGNILNSAQLMSCVDSILLRVQDVLELGIR